jgi:hypothetical protein
LLTKVTEVEQNLVMTDPSSSKTKKHVQELLKTLSDPNIE